MHAFDHQNSKDTQKSTNQSIKVFKAKYSYIGVLDIKAGYRVVNLSIYVFRYIFLASKPWRFNVDVELLT